MRSCFGRSGLLDRGQQKRDGKKGRNGGDPEDRLEVIHGQPHQADGKDWADKGTNRIERLAQAEAGAAQVGRRDVGNERIAWCAPYSFAHTIDETGGDQQFKDAASGKIGFVKAARP